ncbi:hypothetical protein KAR91_38515 [Candidatus Pacearchaeota archaeon]|nr:hypothetical protein [Candidatus Pacearchaeota archaeon]
MKNRLYWCLLVLCLACVDISAHAEVSVAVLKYDSRVPDKPQFGQMVADFLMANLSAKEGLNIVDRVDIDAAIGELKLNLTGIVAAKDKVKIGNFLGADIMLTGNIFILDKNIYISTRAINTETGLVKAIVSIGKADEDISSLVNTLADDLTGFLKKESFDPKQAEYIKNTVDIIKDVLVQAGVTHLPTVAVIIKERQIDRYADYSIAQAELERILIGIGAKVVKSESNEVKTWARDYRLNRCGQIPKDLSGVDIVLIGEAVSEFCSRMKSLAICNARLEIMAIRLKDSKVLASGKTIRKGTELTVNVAGKIAMEKAADFLSKTLLCDTLKNWQNFK